MYNGYIMLINKNIFQSRGICKKFNRIERIGNIPNPIPIFNKNEVGRYLKIVDCSRDFWVDKIKLIHLLYF